MIRFHTNIGTHVHHAVLLFFYSVSDLSNFVSEMNQNKYKKGIFLFLIVRGGKDLPLDPLVSAHYVRVTVKTFQKCLT